MAQSKLQGEQEEGKPRMSPRVCGKAFIPAVSHDYIGLRVRAAGRYAHEEQIKLFESSGARIIMIHLSCLVISIEFLMSRYKYTHKLGAHQKA